MLLIIDNYDSFTYNLVQYFQCLEQEVFIYPHDKITVNDIARLSPDYLVISPGPKAPEDAGISLSAIKHFYQTIPILGICLGHQCLAHAFGGKIIQAPSIMHGKTSNIYHHKQGLFQGIPNHFLATRYHSLVADINTLPACFAIDAWADETIMAISHRQYPLYGLQFHPEAILSEHGLQLLTNFLQYEHKASI
ncbi:aminodeoxychorismate/anthranilate synthase component II [Legionella oakridgensis]|uniref:Glutamine amidotransferase of anthranilate synthase or aminodeoxychorismate synthase n=2 Tax=Legionella oakridgensis TaxID=29423 RepID=W0BAA5_9GAMM|nr:aminodeoxychorismate/anthranilate synthase component II [Legionella oakridgensis]AHE67468.1 glutamine amidotransferase of anthranilate synthase or aminodeoxychorismate synthase [Legionella oakridgensis ATCC 33761 = DSM 21215]ETO92998.1 glutamine amidotransferase of anthranilate synthase or aminodeoxychorismate synthase [Legionella oakridgensis RV-2-2007]KTD43526.1 anthranilate synthase component II [Legionella oakridgensis]STY20518.1 anthranilate synthase component II [Legionella longbeachae